MSAPTAPTAPPDFPRGTSDGTVLCAMCGHTVPAGETFLVIVEFEGGRARACTGCAGAVESTT